MTLSGSILNDDRPASTMERCTRNEYRMARNGVTGPCVAQYGPLAMGNRNSITVPKIASTARPRPKLRNRMNAVCQENGVVGHAALQRSNYQSSRRQTSLGMSRKKQSECWFAFVVFVEVYKCLQNYSVIDLLRPERYQRVHYFASPQTCLPW